MIVVVSSTDVALFLSAKISLLNGLTTYGSAVEAYLTVLVIVVPGPDTVIVVREVAVEVSGVEVVVGMEAVGVEVEVVALADMLVLSISVLSWKRPLGAVTFWVGPKRKTAGCWC